jgi:CHAT domain-containing protein
MIFDQIEGVHQRPVTLTLPDNKAGYASILRSNGAEIQSSRSIELDFDFLKAVSAAIGSLIYTDEYGHRQVIAKFIGQYMWNQLFKYDENLLRSLSQAQGAVSRDENLCLNISSNSHALDLPLELLHDGNEYLALKHTFFRTIRRMQSGRSICLSFPALMQRKREEKKPLRVLLVASNVCSEKLGPIPMVDKEIKKIKKKIQSIIPYNCDIPEVEILNSWETTADRFLKKLEAKYDIVHYAGHGIYDEKYPDKSSLVFYQKQTSEEEWEDKKELFDKWYSDFSYDRRDLMEMMKKSRGKVIRIGIARLAAKFKKFTPSLVYLNCCHSARAGVLYDFAFSNSLGMVDAVARSGVSTVIGHRWPLADEKSSIEFVKVFYDKLLNFDTPEKAIFWARNEISNDTIDWASPVLVKQSYPEG